MDNLFELSKSIIDNNIVDIPTNRMNLQLSELLDNVAMVEAFSHSIIFKTSAGLVVFDASSQYFGASVVKAIRNWSEDRFDTLVYTHGHIDHVGGGRAFLNDTLGRDGPPLRIVGHENLPKRLIRYQLTTGYNQTINQRQFGDHLKERLKTDGKTQLFPPNTVAPNVMYSDQLCLEIGGTVFHLYHDKGETDDHTWAWIPDIRAICAGDFFIWLFPNAGNPRKAQRYPLEWVNTLHRMAALEADYLLPAHGLPIRGRNRIKTVLLDTAKALDTVIQQTLEMMNQGKALNSIINEISLPAEYTNKPYLRPFYDEPEFVIHNLWRLYGGWYDGNPSRLKSPSDQAIAQELAQLAGGATKLAERAWNLAEKGDLKLAGCLVEAAKDADPDNVSIHETRAAIYKSLRKEATSLMAKGIYQSAADVSLSFVNPRSKPSNAGLNPIDDESVHDSGRSL